MFTSDDSIQGLGESKATPDGRVIGAWCAWLGALATNAEAALAAALAYKQLEGPARDSWLAALEQDAAGLSIPRVAVFAPLLAVEADPERRQRITTAMGPSDEARNSQGAARGLMGVDRHGLRVSVVVAPLYLDFVQVLACGYHLNGGFEWVRHEPIIRSECAPVETQSLDGAVLESVPIKFLVDDLAHAVLAHKRSLRPLPEALSFFADLFQAREMEELPAADVR